MKKLKVATYYDGGIVYGPKLGLHGEYANSAYDDAVAPLSKLKRILSEDIEQGRGKAYKRVIK